MVEQPEGAVESPGPAVPSSLDEKQVERVLATARALLAGALVAAIAFASAKSPSDNFIGSSFPAIARIAWHSSFSIGCVGSSGVWTSRHTHR